MTSFDDVFSDIVTCTMILSDTYPIKITKVIRMITEKDPTPGVLHRQCCPP